MTPDHQTLSEAFARAKINLTLHVGAAILDGIYKDYHPVDSLVVFADIGDRLTYDAQASRAGQIELDISGPFSKGLKAESDNLILKAARAFFKAHNLTPQGRFHLEKNLPLASGIGGGSADAAAALRLLTASYYTDSAACHELAATIGADVPVCYHDKTAHMYGIGERVDLKPGYGAVHAVLVNPGFGVSTADIFKAFDQAEAPQPAKPQLWHKDLLACALAGSNDLQEIAISLRPEIKEVIDITARQAGCRLARMSGSGATCFGLFDSAEQAQAAASAIKKEHAHYWCQATVLGELT